MKQKQKDEIEGPDWGFGYGQWHFGKALHVTQPPRGGAYRWSECYNGYGDGCGRGKPTQGPGEKGRENYLAVCRQIGINV
jgi:hypothetical protein